MKLSKYKIKKRKCWFIILCILFLAGIGCITKIADCVTETQEIEARVIHTYEGHNSRYSRKAPKMNIEWLDRNGNYHTEGNLANENHLVVGDTYTILVDAKTQSRRVLSKSGSIFMVISGIFLCVVCLWMVKIFYSKDANERE